MIRDLNRLYRTLPALHARDCEAEGFRWVIVDDRDNSVFAWLRFGDPGDPPVAVVCNFTPVPRYGYRVGLPQAGMARNLNSDAREYGGAGIGNLGKIMADEHPSHGLPASALLTLPPLATVYLCFGEE